MVIILIRRFVKPDREQEFLASYNAQKPLGNPAFKGETLTKVNSEGDLPPGLTSFDLKVPECVSSLFGGLSVDRRHPEDGLACPFAESGGRVALES